MSRSLSADGYSRAVLGAKVSQDWAPEVRPVVNQRWRCSLDPCVHDSGFTWPEAAWMRSSPTADAALRASAISAVVGGLRNGTPFASGVVEAAPTQEPAKQSA